MDYTLGKKCERCGEAVPDDFGNLLCGLCYAKIEEENKLKVKADKDAMFEQTLKNPDSAINPARVEEVKPVTEPAPEAPAETPPLVDDSKLGSIIPDPKFGIQDPNYRENPEADDKEQVLANLAQFIYSHDPKRGRVGKMLWYPQRNMYTFIKNYSMKKILEHPQYPKYLWKPKIVDIGCGSGVGSNIMSQEADMVWGIDKNDFSLEFARECFTREKNGLYYSSQLTFDSFDIVNDTRETMKFDIVVAIEVIEHVHDSDKFLKGMIRFAKRNKAGQPVTGYEATEFFISTPNRAFKKLRKDRPENPYHCRELTCKEFTDWLKLYFNDVQIFNQKGESVPEDSSADEVVFAKCSMPKI